MKSGFRKRCPEICFSFDMDSFPGKLPGDYVT